MYLMAYQIFDHMRLVVVLMLFEVKIFMNANIVLRLLEKEQ
jgi:hypothetical protein